MNTKPNILVICGRNKRRSRTAEYLFKNDSRINIRSAGLSEKSERKLSENDLIWADLVFVMEYEQKTRIKKTFRNLNLPVIIVLEIEDEYEYLDNELILLLNDGINSVLHEKYNI